MKKTHFGQIFLKTEINKNIELSPEADEIKAMLKEEKKFYAKIKKYKKE